jgi:Fe2+ or Zn2+ uptake regulation protein
VKGGDKMKIVCNKCGKIFDIFDKQENFSISTVCGYGTKFDGSAINLHLCCDCMEELIDSCKVSPVESEEDT